MAGVNVKGINVHWRKNRANSTASMPPPSMMPSTSTCPSAELHLHKLSIVTDEISADMAPPAASSIPSTSPPSALTSASRGKRKASTLGSDVEAPSGKRSRPPSMTAKAQQEGSAAMSLLTTAVEAMSKHLSAPPPVLVVPADFARAIEVISDAPYVSDEDKVDMTQLFVKEKDQATTFLYLKGDNLRATWVRRKVAEIRAMSID